MSKKTEIMENPLILLCILLVFCTSCSGGQNTPGNTQGSGGGGGSSIIQGLITEPDGFTPVIRATVTLSSESEDESMNKTMNMTMNMAGTTTDENGEYEFQGVSQGEHMIRCTNSNYVATNINFSVTSSITELHNTMVGMDKWNNFMGDDNHPYNSESGYIIVRVVGGGEESASSLTAGVTVMCDPSSYQAGGYVTAGVVSWGAQSTSNEGKGFFYGVPMGQMYMISATGPQNVYDTLSEVMPVAGEIAEYYLMSVDSAGTLKWSCATAGAIQSSPSIAADGTIYAGSHDGNLYTLARLRLRPTSRWCSMIFP